MISVYLLLDCGDMRRYDRPMGFSFWPVFSPCIMFCELRPFLYVVPMVAPKGPIGKNYGEKCGSVPLFLLFLLSHG